MSIGKQPVKEYSNFIMQDDSFRESGIEYTNDTLMTFHTLRLQMYG